MIFLRLSLSYNILISSCNVFFLRVFNTNDWSFQEWVCKSEVSCCAWSPCSTYISFCTTSPAMLYSVCPASGSSSATPLADLTAVQLTDNDGASVTVGGSVRGIAWGGERLVLYFHACPYLLLLHTLTLSSLKIAINGIIKGPEDCVPATAAFHPRQTALLTVAWSDGTLQHIPLIYTSRQTTSNTPAPYTHESPVHNLDSSRFNLSNVNTSFNGTFGAMPLNPTSPLRPVS